MESEIISIPFLCDIMVILVFRLGSPIGLAYRENSGSLSRDGWPSMHLMLFFGLSKKQRWTVTGLIGKNSGKHILIIMSFMMLGLY